MPIIEGAGQLGEGIGGARTRLARGDYSFAVDGGVVGTINLGAQLPSGALVLSAYIEVLTALTSGGAATLALQLEGANDVQTAVVISGAPWSSTGQKLSSARTRAAVALKLTAARELAAVIGTADLTAGIFRVYVEYLEAP